MPQRGKLISSDERKKYGVTVTLRSETTGDVFVDVEPGPMTGAIVRLCERWASQAGGPWRLQTISTPDSIYRDLTAPLMVDPAFTDAREKQRRNQYAPRYEGWLVTEVPHG